MNRKGAGNQPDYTMAKNEKIWDHRLKVFNMKDILEIQELN